MDVDWVRDFDNRKSTTGMIFSYENALVYWSGKLQQTITLFTIKVEYKSLVDRARKSIWPKGLLVELGDEQKRPMKIIL